MIPRKAVWQGWLDSNQRVRESKSLALPLGYTPICERREGGRSRSSGPAALIMGWVKGFEPSTPGTTIRCSNQLSYTHHITILSSGKLNLSKADSICSGCTGTQCEEHWRSGPCSDVARLEGLEPPAHCLEGSCSTG